VKKVFILDDSIERIPLLRKVAVVLNAPDECEFHIAHEVNEAIKKLPPKSSWDLLFLDHDLAGQVYLDSSHPDTGYHVAKHIEKNEVGFKFCILHSMNFAGAENMESVLKDKGKVVRVPFVSLRSMCVWSGENGEV